MMNLKTKKVEEIRFNNQTQYQKAKSIKEFIVKDVFLVDIDSVKIASKIKRILVELPQKFYCLDPITG